jgi:hypothetical protein
MRGVRRKITTLHQNISISVYESKQIFDQIQRTNLFDGRMEVVLYIVKGYSIPIYLVF